MIWERMTSAEIAAVDRATADDAWAASAAIDRTLAARPVADRLRAAIRVRTMSGPPP